MGGGKVIYRHTHTWKVFARINWRERKWITVVWDRRERNFLFIQSYQFPLLGFSLTMAYLF